MNYRKLPKLTAYHHQRSRDAVLEVEEPWNAPVTLEEARKQVEEHLRPDKIKNERTVKTQHTKRFLELMQRNPDEKINGKWCHTNEEIVYLAKEDLVTFGEKYLGESYYYMYELS
jgi:hypothetical protein